MTHIDTKMKRYLEMIDISSPHNQDSPIANMDFWIRMFIKTDDIFSPMLSHSAIINREMQGEICRICLKGLEQVVKLKRFICNDYLILRHPQCINPICSQCIKDKPDDFYKAYRKGLDLYQEWTEFQH